MQNIKVKFLNAIENWRLKLQGWKRNWYNYVVDIQELVWARNLRDWYNIFVYDKNMIQLAEINIDNNLWTVNYFEK